MSHIDSVNQEACAQLLRLCYSVSTLRRLPIYVRSTLTLRKLLFGCYCTLVTHGWEKSANTAFGYEALEYVSTRFLVPLENASVNCAVLNEEWDNIVEYAKRYLNLVQDDYKVIWWKLFNSPDSTKWTNVLAVVELPFCLPVSNGHLERVFSQLKLVKSEQRTCLGEDRLDQLVCISVEAPVLAQWDPSSAVELW